VTKYHLDDPKLTSYVLDELQGFDRENVQNFLGSDSAGKARSEVTRKVLRMISGALPPATPFALTDAEKEGLIEFWRKGARRSGLFTFPRVVALIGGFVILFGILLLVPEFLTSVSHLFQLRLGGSSNIADKFALGEPARKTQSGGDSHVATVAPTIRSKSDSRAAMKEIPQGHWIVVLDQAASMRKSGRLAGFVQALSQTIHGADPTRHFSVVSYDSRHDHLWMEYVGSTSETMPAGVKGLEEIGDTGEMKISSGLASALTESERIARTHQSSDEANVIILVTDHDLEISQNAIEHFGQNLKIQQSASFFVIGFGHALGVSTKATDLTSAGSGAVFLIP
jgi:hypothetical protein